MVQQELEKEYEIYRQRIKKLYPKKQITFPKQQNDERVLKNVLALVKDQDVSATYMINNFIKSGDVNRLKKAIVMSDQAWKNNMNRSEMSWFMKNQPLNMAFINIIKGLGLTNFPVKVNEKGWPEYPKHLLNKFVVMNILEQMIKAGTITPDQKDTIDNLLFDEATKKVIEKEINDYRTRTNSKYREEPEAKDKAPDADVDSTEIAAPERFGDKDRKARLNMLRQLARKNQTK
jgi:hypothetical protein